MTVTTVTPESTPTQYDLVHDRELFNYLINCDEFPAFSRLAQRRLEDVLQACRVLSEDRSADLPDELQCFSYSEAAFDQRMMQLRCNHRQQVNDAQPSSLQVDQLTHLLKQYAPASLLDGCWLQNISLASNCHLETVAGLFHLYVQKIGDGETAQHLGNLYRNLLHSAGIHLPEVNSRLFTTQKEILDSAFTRPVFQLALSLSSRTYLPELIGYTLGHYVAPHDYLLPALMSELQRCGLDQRYCQQYMPTIAGEDDTVAPAAMIIKQVKDYLASLGEAEA